MPALIAVVLTSHVKAADISHSFQNSLLARSFGMAGAVSALDNWPGFLLFNSAASPFQSTKEYPEIKIMLNPVSTLESLVDLRTGKRWDPADFAGQAGMIAPFISLNYEQVQVSLMLTQPLPDNPHANGRAFADAGALLDWHYHLLAVRLKLDPRVSIGGSGYLFVTRDNNAMDHQTAFGTNYSVMIRPSNTFQAGISYYNIQQAADSLLFNYHRVIDNTLNVGVSWFPFKQLAFTCDIRNVAEEENAKARELHTGLQYLPNHFISVRGGYYFNNSRADHVITAGIGWMDNRPYKKKQNFWERIVFQYGVQAMTDDNLNVLHYATLLLQF